MPYKQIVIDFSPSEAELIAYIEKQENPQDYIKLLIQADMEYKKCRYSGNIPPKGYTLNANLEPIIDEEQAKLVQEAINNYIKDTNN